MKYGELEGFGPCQGNIRTLGTLLKEERMALSLPGRENHMLNVCREDTGSENNLSLYNIASYTLCVCVCVFLQRRRELIVERKRNT